MPINEDLYTFYVFLRMESVVNKIQFGIRAGLSFYHGVKRNTVNLNFETMLNAPDI